MCMFTYKYICSGSMNTDGHHESISLSRLFIVLSMYIYMPVWVYIYNHLPFLFVYLFILLPIVLNEASTCSILYIYTLIVYT